MDKPNKIIGFFLVHSMDCGIGGMESHQRAFIDYFFKSMSGNTIQFRYIIENDKTFFHVIEMRNSKITQTYKFIDFSSLKDFINQISLGRPLIFLNDGWWIENVIDFRETFPNSCIFLRSGGNDIELAPWNRGNFTYLKRRELWKKSIDHLNFIISNSDYSVSRLNNLSVSKSKIVKIRGGVNSKLCLKLKSRKEVIKTELRDNLNIKQKYIFLFACRFVPFKGILQTLKILKESSIHGQYHLIFVGSGKLKADIIKWCNENLKYDEFSFLGELSNDKTLEIIVAVDVLLNLSIECLTQSGDGFYIHTETMGRSMIEAISLGTKIYATNVGGIAELFDENESIGALLASDGTTIKRGFDNIDNILREKATNLKDYSWEKVFQMYNHLFLSTL